MSSSASDSTFTGQPATSSNDTGNATSSSSLYLFTFLSTLLLLLLVSCGIVFRAQLIRRRYQRRVEGAVEAGYIPPYQVPGRRQRDIGPKPALWETWLAPPAYDEARWSEINPVSVKVVSDTATGDGLPYDKSSNGGNSSRSAFPSDDPESHPPRRLLVTIPFTFTHRRSPSPSPAASPAPLLSPSPTEDVENPPAKFQVAVLIAMPSPYRPQSWASVDQDATRTTHVEHHGTCSTRDNLDSEEDLPDVVFGVAEVPWNVREDDRTPPNE